MRVLIVSNSIVDPPCSRLRNVLRAKFDSHTPPVTRYEDVEKSVTRIQPEILFVIVSSDPERGLAALRRARPVSAACVLAVGDTADPKLILRALDGGADAYLDDADLECGLDGVLAKLRVKRDAAPPAGRLLAVLGASGGSGASTLAVNLAAVLARDHGKTALVDLKPGRGDLSALLDLKPSFHLADLCQNLARLDQAMFDKALTAHDSGVHLLASPQLFGDARLVSAEGVNEVLTLARRRFTHVVVDLEDCFHEEQVTALRQASTTLIVTRLDFTSLRNVRRILDHLEERGVSREQLRIAVNRFGQANELPAADAEEALGDKLAYFIPDDARTVNGANNAGVPAVLKSPNAKVSTALTQMARSVLERRRVDAPVPARSSWFS